MKIITIEREYGSGGSFIAEKLAQRLGWKLWDRSLTEEIAKMAKVEPSEVERCDEHVDHLLHRLAKVFARGSYERILPVEAPQDFDTDQMVAMVQRVIENAAAKGNCVVVGRGAPWILRHHPHAFHIFIYGPREEKIKRIQGIGKSLAEATELVDTIDQERAAFVKRYFGKTWPTRQLYHMMINSTIGDDLAVETILRTMESFEKSRSTQ